MSGENDIDIDTGLDGPTDQLDTTSTKTLPALSPSQMQASHYTVPLPAGSTIMNPSGALNNGPQFLPKGWPAMPPMTVANNAMPTTAPTAYLIPLSMVPQANLHAAAAPAPAPPVNLAGASHVGGSAVHAQSHGVHDVIMKPDGITPALRSAPKGHSKCALCHQHRDSGLKRVRQVDAALWSAVTGVRLLAGHHCVCAEHLDDAGLPRLHLPEHPVPFERNGTDLLAELEESERQCVQFILNNLSPNTNRPLATHSHATVPHMGQNPLQPMDRS